jgi:hypothetical protein
MSIHTTINYGFGKLCHEVCAFVINFNSIKIK